MLEIKRLTPTAKMPTRGTDQAAGLDLYADSFPLESDAGHGYMTVVSTGIAVKIPEGFVGLVQPRSGLAFKYGVDTLAGVIDRDYRGELKVLITSHDVFCEFEVGDRITQLLIMPVLMCTPIEVDELDATERGANGFGSSGR